METTGWIRHSYNGEDGKFLLIQVDTIPKDVDGKKKIEIKQWREKRSISANNYAWKLMGEIAKVLRSTKEEIYLIMLERYGSFLYLLSEEKDREKLEQTFRIVRDRGASPVVTESGKKVIAHTYQCYKGSSLYDTKEMSIFIDGLVDECKDMDIETEPPEALRRMIEEWEVENESKN